MTRLPKLTCLLLLSGCLSISAAGCSDDDSNPSACAGHLLPGDLVITEIMPNPQGADEGKEWFEVYNATTASIDLKDLRLVYSGADGTNRKTHLVSGGLIGPGEYMVFGGMLDVAKPAYVDYGYGSSLGTMTNSGGRLALECGNTVVDQVVYLEAADGVSLSFNGNLVPDAVANDTLASWCDSQTEFEAGSFGTPGAANDPCGPVVPPGTCLEGGVSRDTVPPAAGTVIITEFMADPSAVGDTAGEWVELHFTQAADLNGLQLGAVVGTVQHTVSDATCIPVAAGGYVLLARNADPAANGGLPTVDAVWPNLALSNTGGGIFVGYGGTVLDQVAYTDPMVQTGASASLDATALDVTQNDDPAAWCVGTAVYGAGDRGTPRAANPSCGGAPQDTCLDGGTPRSILPPQAGDLVISEIMADPAAVNDTAGEWFEVYFDQAADLNGLQLGTAAPTVAFTVTGADCIHVTAGSYVLFARNGDSGANGGLPTVDVVYTGINLANAGGNIFVGFGGAVLDQVAYTDPMVSPGESAALDPGFLTTTGNDTPANWCNGTTVYGLGDRGTPGAANPSCGIVPPNSCLDNGTPRSIVPPVAGDVVINEIMPDPFAVADNAGEWFEVYFAQAADLNGLEMGATVGTVAFTATSADCIHVSAGTYAIIAKNGTTATNGGLPQVQVEWAGMSLSNSGGSLFVGYGGNLLDAITYPSAGTPQTRGRAIALDPSHRNTTDNDTAANWCLAATTYGDGDSGTPGAANPACP
ncbi:MAG: lamin tail domain-containing protein [Polyangia bacterium]|jgi:hypothetical protein|nr:lamin tail domain-containing protein [Polyangia bacterium]